MEIIITKRVVFQDWNGKVLRVYEVGTVLQASAPKDLHHFITGMGGIFHSEAEVYDPPIELLENSFQALAAPL